MNKLYKNWIVHNMLGHPLMQVMIMIGCDKLASKVHDGTLPESSDHQ